MRTWVASTMIICRGEVWDVKLDPTVEAEIQKTRPCIVISSDRMGRLPLRVVIPTTGWKDHFEGAPWFVRIEPDAGNGLDKLCAADAFQVRSVAEARFKRKRGVIPASLLNDIVSAMGIVIEIDP